MGKGFRPYHNNRSPAAAAWLFQSRRSTLEYIHQSFQFSRFRHALWRRHVLTHFSCRLVPTGVWRHQKPPTRKRCCSHSFTVRAILSPSLPAFGRFPHRPTRWLLSDATRRCPQGLTGSPVAMASPGGLRGEGPGRGGLDHPPPPKKNRTLYDLSRSKSQV